MRMEDLSSFNELVGGISHPNLRVLWVECNHEPGPKKRDPIVKTVWKQCPKLQSFHWNGVWFNREVIKRISGILSGVSGKILLY